jgi:hypothetical protein
MKLEWSPGGTRRSRPLRSISATALPSLAEVVAEEIIEKAQILVDHSQLGWPIAGRQDCRQLLLSVLNATYVFQYRFDGRRLLMLRVFHSRENRE